MQLTNKQELGLKLAIARYKAHESYTCIAGYAGTGKSTLIKFIINALEINPETDVAYVAYTGKAATVLQTKGCPNATTAHKLLYEAKPRPNGTFYLKKRWPIPYKVIIVDEISMLPKTMWDLLLSHHKYVIACGDPFQLPPVDQNEDNHVLDKPHIFLDEIMRQAQDSEIIRLSMWVREGKPLGQFPVAKEQVQILRPYELIPEMYDWADQTLCASNKRRIEINNKVRERQGRGATPEIGDKIIGLTNHWDFTSTDGLWPLTNGCIGTITNYQIIPYNYPSFIYNKQLQYIFTGMDIPNGRFESIPIDYDALITGTPAFDNKQAFRMNSFARNSDALEAPYYFAYAYAITVWKAQGSEWDKVLLIEEAHPFDTLEHQKYLYTGITRASEKLVVIRK